MKKIKLLAAILALSTFNIANAATASAPMQVTATVEPKCNISATNMNFGTIQLGEGAPIGNSSVTVECTKGTPYSIAFNGGLNSPLLSTVYRLKHATLNEYLEYMLSIPNQVIISPNQTSISGTGNGIGTGFEKVTVIQGVLNTSANVNVTPGSYSDIVTITLTY